MPTRVRNVSYFKADDMLGYKTTSQSDDRFARIAYCAGYTDEFQTIRIPKNQQFETILNEDLGNADGNVLKWQYQYFFPTSLSVLGLDSDYSVTFESYDLDGNSVLDRYGEEVIESIEAIDKTVKGFKIQFVLNKSAFQFGDSFSETQDEPEGGRVKQDVIVRFKLNDEYAVPIILPSFAFDGPVGEDQDFSAQRLLYGAKIETPIEGESLLASGVTAEASAGVTTGNWGNELVQQINEGSTGWDLPLWVKKKVFVRRVTLTGSHRPQSAVYDVVTNVDPSQYDDPPQFIKTLSGSSPAAEGSNGDQGDFTIERQTSNFFDLRMIHLPEPLPSEDLVTEQNGQITLELSVKEKQHIFKHPIQSFGEQRVSTLKYTSQASGVGDLRWEKRGPASIAILAENGATEPSFFKATVKHNTVPGDLYLVGATDGTFGGMRRNGSGIFPMINAMRTQLTAIKSADNKVGGTLNNPVALEMDPEITLRRLTERLQRVKTILYKNGMMVLDGSAETGDTTEILKSPLLGEHLQGTQGNAPLADPSAVEGSAGQQIFKSEVTLPANSNGIQVSFPEHVKIRQQRGELNLSGEDYLVVLDVFGAGGQVLSFSEADNPFSIESKTEIGFSLLCSQPFLLDVLIQYRVCLFQLQDNTFQKPKALPVISPNDSTFFEVGTALSQAKPFYLNSFKSMKSNAIALEKRLDHFRNITRHGQNIPLAWCTLDWKYDSFENYEGGTPTLKVARYGTGQQGFKFAPQLEYQRLNIYDDQEPTPRSLSLNNNGDVGVETFPDFLTRSYNYRLRFYYGVPDASISEAQSHRNNYPNYDPGLFRLNPEQEFADSVPISPDGFGDPYSVPFGFGRGLLITEKIKLQPVMEDETLDWEVDVWPPHTSNLLFSTGCYSTQAGQGVKTFPDGSQQRYVDYLIWVIRSYPADMDSTYGKDLYQTSGGGVAWCESRPINVILMGRPLGVGLNVETSTFFNDDGKRLYSNVIKKQP